MGSQELPFAVQVAIRARDHQAKLTMQQTLLMELMDQSQRQKLYLELMGFEFDLYRTGSVLEVGKLIEQLRVHYELYHRNTQFAVQITLAATGCIELLEASLAAWPASGFGYNTLGFSAMRNDQWSTLDRLLELTGLPFEHSPIKLSVMINRCIEEGYLDKIRRLNDYIPVYDKNSFGMLQRLRLVPMGRVDILEYLLDSYPPEASATKEEHLADLAWEHIRRLKSHLPEADPEQIRFTIERMSDSDEKAKLRQALLELGVLARYNVVQHYSP